MKKIIEKIKTKFKNRKDGEPRPRRKPDKQEKILLALVAVGLVLMGFAYYYQFNRYFFHYILNIEPKELIIRDIKEGTGVRQVEEGDVVAIHYVARFLNNKPIKDTVEEDRYFIFTVGEGNVIRAWNEGIIGMKEGGKRMLTVPSSMAYGSSGIRKLIEPDTPLIFEIYLLKIKP